jgi:SAM-dependent methyltransferase
LTYQDPDYLIKKQYRDGGNLESRIQIHERFSQNPQGLHSWMHGIFRLSNASQVLEVGGGTGQLWDSATDDLAFDLRLTLTDLSPGMLAEAEARLASRFKAARFQVADIAQLDFPPASFDVVMAHFMLYHVPDLQPAFDAVCRVLSPQGHFYATTVGEDHLAELKALVQAYAPDEVIPGFSPTFTLENSLTQLGTHFVDFERMDYPDHLLVSEPEPLVRYILSSSPPEWHEAHRLADLHRYVEARLNSGPIHITKSVGMLRCRPR